MSHNKRIPCNPADKQARDCLARHSNLNNSLKVSLVPLHSHSNLPQDYLVSHKLNLNSSLASLVHLHNSQVSNLVLDFSQEVLQLEFSSNLELLARLNPRHKVLDFSEPQLNNLPVSLAFSANKSLLSNQEQVFSVHLRLSHNNNLEGSVASLVKNLLVRPLKVYSVSRV